MKKGPSTRTAVHFAMQIEWMTHIYILHSEDMLLNCLPARRPPSLSARSNRRPGPACSAGDLEALTPWLRLISKRGFLHVALRERGWVVSTGASSCYVSIGNTQCWGKISCHIPARLFPSSRSSMKLLTAARMYNGCGVNGICGLAPDQSEPYPIADAGRACPGWAFCGPRAFIRLMEEAGRLYGWAASGAPRSA